MPVISHSLTPLSHFLTLALSLTLFLFSLFSLSLSLRMLSLAIKYAICVRQRSAINHKPLRVINALKEFTVPKFSGSRMKLRALWTNNSRQRSNDNAVARWSESYRRCTVDFLRRRPSSRRSVGQRADTKRGPRSGTAERHPGQPEAVAAVVGRAVTTPTVKILGRARRRNWRSDAGRTENVVCAAGRLRRGDVQRGRAQRTKRRVARVARPSSKVRRTAARSSHARSQGVASKDHREDRKPGGRLNGTLEDHDAR